MDEHNEEDIKAYLAKIRKTIADSKELVSQAQLRMAETDRMLERQGLTREQVMSMRFSEAQREAVNSELRRQGMEPFDEWEPLKPDEERPSPFAPLPEDSGGDLENRQRKFGMMMKPFQI